MNKDKNQIINSKSTNKKSKPWLSHLPPYKFKINEFAMRGLNKYRNILSPPICDCCGEPGFLQIESKDELTGFCAETLLENGCSRSAIFCVHKDGVQEIYLTIPGWDDEEECEIIENIGSFVDNNIDAFAKADAELGFHCYGLMIEKENGWEICD